jgi:crotonobetainyl-CoA:carnitine CoA-transferase CaiB-like acyl-CoA transferase
MISRTLDGILGLEVGRFLAGPPPAIVVSDFGAEVLPLTPPSPPLGARESGSDEGRRRA